MTCLFVGSPELPAGELLVTELGKSYSPAPGAVLVLQSKFDEGGSTSVRNVEEQLLEWKPLGYYQRNRDLGQVFTSPADCVITAVVLRTGASDAAVLPGAAGAKVFMQWFEVSGEPRLCDNGTPQGTKASHGFSPNHRCDDYIDGVSYHPAGVARGVLPQLKPTRGAGAGGQGRLSYLRFQFAAGSAPSCKAGQRYAFLVGFETPGALQGFTLANFNAAGTDAPARLGDRHDAYAGGWAIRREGGRAMGEAAPGNAPPADPNLRRRLVDEAMLPDGEARYATSPVTDGYPDVDTYRDLEFYLEGQVRKDVVNGK